MSPSLVASPQAPKMMTEPTAAHDTLSAVKRVVIVAEPEQDLSWLSRLKAVRFDPILLVSNFDAVQRMTEDHELNLVLFAQRSAMMDGITACQLLRQSRSEADAAIVLVLDQNLDDSIVEAFAAGASDVVCQPCTAAELVARLDATLQRLLLWNDVETVPPLGSPTASTTAIYGEECVQKRPHFGRSKRPAAPKPMPESAPEPTVETPVPTIAEAIAPVAAPARPAPVAAAPVAAPRLLTDWLRTHDLPHELQPPALDLSQLKFVSTMPRRQIETARQQGQLREVLIDRVWVCPQCRALPSFRPACPCCGSAGVERDRMLHHFACAFVGSTAQFQVSDEGLACPKCCTRRLIVGTDCEYLDGPWRCPDCDWNTAELEIVGHCLKCGFRFPAQQAALEDLVGHHVDRLAALADVAHAH